MKTTIAPVRCPVGRFSLKIRDPGIVRHVGFELTKKLVMEAGRADFEETLVLFIEAAMDMPIREHQFVVIGNGGTVETTDAERAVYRGTGISGKAGIPLHVFELLEASS